MHGSTVQDENHDGASCKWLYRHEIKKELRSRAVLRNTDLESAEVSAAWKGQRGL